MPNEKLKSENYQNFGGINSKFSPYVTGPMEFLDIQNLDLQTPGSLTERWGSTMYFGQTFPGPVNSLFEFSLLNGSSFVFASFSGGIFYGATTGQNQGVSFSLQSVTTVTSFYNFFITTTNLSPPGFLPSAVIYPGADRLQTPTSGTFVISAIAQSDNILSHTVLDNRLFLADGNKFVKFDGATTYPVGTPPISLPFIESSYAANGLSMLFSSLNASLLGLAVGQNYAVYFSYTNNRGLEGQIWPLCVIDNSINGASAASNGGTFLESYMAIATPLALGISAVNCYIWANGTTKIGFGANGARGSSYWNTYDYTRLSVNPASGSTLTWIAIGTTVGGQSLMLANQFPLPDTVNQSYGVNGLTAISTQAGFVTEFDITNFAPRYLENYQNRLFLAGFSTTPSIVWFSDLAEPEGYAPDFNFEVRTNDGDFITAMRAYSTRLYIFKQNSFHALNGDSPNNFFLQEISDQYGCINNRCAVIYDDILVFLDRKGIIVWNGANLSILSAKVQPYLDRMNYSAALTVACMVHDKLRNQILIGIPVDGSTTNNITLVYDYLAAAWTTYKGYTPSAFASIQGRNNTKNAFYGDTQGRVNWFGSSFLSDNGIGFTTYFKTRFLHDMGDSTTKMFRRMFLNTDSPSSSTLVFGVNMYQDYGSSIVYGTTIILSDFQNRIDFGVSGKSLAFELANIQSNIRLRIHGFTIESRFLRRV